MYVIWRSGLQPRWLLHITHILFRCAAMEGGTPAGGFSFFKRNVIYERKSSRLFFLFTKDCFSCERPLCGSLRQRPCSFLQKLPGFKVSTLCNILTMKIPVIIIINCFEKILFFNFLGNYLKQFQ